MNEKLLTISIPTFNRACKLERLMNVLLLYPVCELEILICDNASEDNTQDICSNYILDNSNVNYIRNSKNLGYDKNVILCLENSITEYVWFLSDDDLVSLELINKVIINLKQKKPDGMLINARVLADSHQEIIPKLNSKLINELVTVNEDVFVEYSKWSTLISSQVIKRRIVNTNDLVSYIGTCFVQLPLFWNSLKERELMLLSDCFIDKFDSESHDFQQTNSKLWFVNWSDVIFSLEQFSVKSRNKAITNLYGKGVFSFSGVIAHLFMAILNDDANKSKLTSIISRLNLTLNEQVISKLLIIMVSRYRAKMIIKTVKKIKAIYEKK